MTEQEEFEFRARLEAEQGGAEAPKQPPVERFNAMQKRMGLGKQGDTMGAIHRARERGIYELGGAVTDATGMPYLGAVTNAAADMATDPLTYIGGAFGSAAKPLLRSQGLEWMQQALRPTLKDLRLGKADRAAQTLLNEGVNVTRGGVEKLRGMGAELNATVDDIIKQSGGTVDKNAVASRLQDVVKRIEAENWTPEEARAAVEKVYDSFLKNPLVPQNMPLVQAQKLKQGIYKELKDKYGALGSDTEEAMKAGARGFKEEIEGVVPQVKPLNERASEIWNALNVAERRALMAGNNQIGGISWLAHNPLAWAASMADRSSAVKSLMARFAHNGAAPVAGGIGAGIGGGAGVAEEGILKKREAWLGPQ